MLTEVAHWSNGSSLICYWISALSAPWSHLGAVKCQRLPPSSVPAWRFWLNFSGMQMEHRGGAQLPQVILIYSQGWEPLPTREPCVCPRLEASGVQAVVLCMQKSGKISPNIDGEHHRRTQAISLQHWLRWKERFLDSRFLLWSVLVMKPLCFLLRSLRGLRDIFKGSLVLDPRFGFDKQS